MNKIIKSIITYMKPQGHAMVGLSSFRIKSQKLMTAPKPQIKEKSSLNFNLLH